MRRSKVPFLQQANKIQWDQISETTKRFYGVVKFHYIVLVELFCSELEFVVQNFGRYITKLETKCLAGICEKSKVKHKVMTSLTLTERKLKQR